MLAGKYNSARQDGNRSAHYAANSLSLVGAVSIGTGADEAIECAGFALVKGDLNGIVRAHHLARATMRKIKQNLFFALVYNASGVPVTSGVLFLFLGILISPIYGPQDYQADSNGLLRALSPSLRSDLPVAR